MHINSLYQCTGFNLLLKIPAGLSRVIIAFLPDSSHIYILNKLTVSVLFSLPLRVTLKGLIELERVRFHLVISPTTILTVLLILSRFFLLIYFRLGQKRVV